MSIVVKLLRACAKSEPGDVQSKFVNSYNKSVMEFNDLKVNGIVNKVFTNISEEKDDIYPLLLLK